MENSPATLPAIEFDLAIEDIAELPVHQALRSPAVKQQILKTRLMVSAGGVLAVLASAYFTQERLTPVYIAISVVAFVVIFLVYPMTVRRTMRTNVLRYLTGTREGELGFHKLQVEEAGLRGRYGGSKSVVPWSELGPVEETKSHVFILKGEDEGWAIPKAAVRNPEALAPFIAEVKARVGH